MNPHRRCSTNGVACLGTQVCCFLTAITHSRQSPARFQDIAHVLQNACSRVIKEMGINEDVVAKLA